jgi:glutathione S-transferase
MLTLYEFGNSVCCQKVRLTLSLKNLEWQSVQVNLFKSEQYEEKYLKLNPKGVVPTLVHDNRSVVESTLICEYLDDIYPTPKLTPQDPYLKSQMRIWSKLVDEGLHEGISEISFSAMFREKMKNMTPAEREVRLRNVGDQKRYDRFQSTFEKGVESPFVGYAIQAYDRAFVLLESALSHDQPWILGQELTLADVNLIPYVARLHFLDLLNVWLEDQAHIKKWWTRVQELPQFHQSILQPMKAIEIQEMQHYGQLIAPQIKACLEALRAGLTF